MIIIFTKEYDFYLDETKYIVIIITELTDIFSKYFENKIKKHSIY
jgi:hypothetical protein